MLSYLTEILVGSAAAVAVYFALHLAEGAWVFLRRTRPSSGRAVEILPESPARSSTSVDAAVPDAAVSTDTKRGAP